MRPMRAAARTHQRSPTARARRPDPPSADLPAIRARRTTFVACSPAFATNFRPPNLTPIQSRTCDIRLKVSPVGDVGGQQRPESLSVRSDTYVQEFVDNDVVLEPLILAHEVKRQRDVADGRAVAPPVLQIFEA